VLPERIPLFPLPNVVLFPQMPLPLHVFEPRYRQMVADARHGHDIIGMVLLKPGWEPIYQGRPPVFAIGCAGRIEQCETLPDGRYNLVLRGVERFQIAEEHGSEPYRVASVRPQAETHDAAALEAVRTTLIDTLQKANPQEAVAFEGQLPPDLFVNALCQSLDLTPLERQALLDCDDLAVRGQRLVEVLAFKRLERHAGPHRLH
jgi:Lon protease-like protein